MKKAIVAGLGVLAVAAAFAAKDPIIMTVNGVDVPKSEFEYLYNKNSQQQINPQTLDEYVEMFKLYKMKVADAKAEGLDTLPAFIKEMNQYKHELAAPYMADSVYLNKLVDEAYERSGREVEAYHIMLFKTRDDVKNAELRARADSLRQVLLNGGDFADLASRFSQDRGSAQRGGRMGYILAGQYPYSFEVADFALPEGEISEVVESPVGYHILKGGKSRPARGKVRVAHILKVTRGLDDAGKAKAKAAIDSLYKLVVANPERFAELAQVNSEDPGSKRQGGNLPAFGAGEMVAEFDSVAFMLPVNGISEPFESAFGYHIIKKFENIAPAGKAAVKTQQLRMMANPRDERSEMIRHHLTDRYAPAHKASLNDKNVKMMKAYVEKNGLDSLFYAQWVDGANAGMTLMSVDGRNIPAGEMLGELVSVRQSNPAIAAKILDDNIDKFFSSKVLEAEENRLAANVPELKNLMKEYTDGSLLYEVSVRKVWDKAAKDTKGMEKYFNQHKQDYKWIEPHVKGLFIQTVNDSVADLIKKRAAELKESEIGDTIRKEFKNQVAVEQVLIAKGGNPMIDHVAFGGPKVESSIARYKTYFMINPRILTEPEELSDVKGQVTSDYQNMFQEQWEKELRAKYPVKVNDKVLKKVKSK